MSKHIHIEVIREICQWFGVNAGEITTADDMEYKAFAMSCFFLCQIDAEDYRTEEQAVAYYFAVNMVAVQKALRDHAAFIALSENYRFVFEKIKKLIENLAAKYEIR